MLDLSREQHAGRHFPARIDGSLDASHLLDSRARVEIHQQMLFDRVPADAVLGKWRASETDRFLADGEHRRLSSFDLDGRSRQDVGVQIAVALLNAAAMAG